MNYATQYFPVHRLHLIESYTLIAYRIITQMVRSLSVALNAKCIQYRRSEVRAFYFVVSDEISVYLMKIKVVSITSEMISYHFTIISD